VGLAAAAVLVAAGLTFAATRGPSAPPTIEEQVQQIGSQLQCVACVDLSVADSPANTARAMRLEIARRLQAGETPAEVKAFFVRRYGESILLEPPARGFSLIPWLAPGLAFLAGVALFLTALRRRGREARAGEAAPAPPTAADRARIARELAAMEEPD
jgi:cytochrome c-type biogenesis protein CcmH